ncbi:MAG: response regulator [Myxococcota bacterium]
MADEGSPEGQTVARLAHRMNNAVAYVLTNLNLLAEELEGGGERDRKLGQLVTEATGGAERLTELIRELKMLAWGEPEPVPDDSLDDTWDEDRRPRRILVVDDEPYILASIRRALRHYDVVVAEGGQRALEILADEPGFDLVLCDLVMGAVTGMDVHRWIRTNRPGLLDRVIFMTAGAFTGEVREFLATVDNLVLHKPFDTKTLRWMIAQSLRRGAASGTA